MNLIIVCNWSRVRISMLQFIWFIKVWVHPNLNVKCLEDCVVVSRNTIKQEFILHCEMLHCLKRNNTRHYATLWEVTCMLHCTMLCSDIDYKITFWKRNLWLAKSCFYNCMENKERFTLGLGGLAFFSSFIIKPVFSV